MKIEKIVKLTQKKLFKKLSKRFKKNAYVGADSFILVEGEAPIMLVAHLDTVHVEPVQNICVSADGNILMSPQGIGGDDRCGVYVLVNAYERSVKKPWLLFTTDEEIGGVGADIFCEEYRNKKIPKSLGNLKLIVEVDRRGSKDAVYYDCDNAEFESYITSKGFVTDHGSFSDISFIAPELGIAAVNLSSGYYSAHTLHEYINRKEMNDTLEKVIDIVADAAKDDFPVYPYIEKKRPACDKYSLVSSYRKKDKAEQKKLPLKYEQIYDDLLDFYTAEELDMYRQMYGDEIIQQIYCEEYGALYDYEK